MNMELIRFLAAPTTKEHHHAHTGCWLVAMDLYDMVYRLPNRPYNPSGLRTGRLFTWATQHRSINPAVREMFDMEEYAGESTVHHSAWSCELLTFVKRNRTLIQNLPENVCIFEEWS